MPPAARKELQLRLSVTTDALQSSTAMKQLASDAERVAAGATKAQTAMRGLNSAIIGAGGTAFGSPVPRVLAQLAPKPKAAPGIFSQVNDSLGLSGIGGFARFAAPAVLATTAANVLKTGALTAADETMPADVRSRSIIKALPFGETALDFSDAFTGRARDIARQQEFNQYNAGESQARIGLDRGLAGLNQQVGSAQARAGVLGRASPVTLPNVDRSSALGDQQYQLESKLLQVRTKGALADQDAAVAAEEATKAKERQLEVEKRSQQLEGEREGLEKELRKNERRGELLASGPYGLVLDEDGQIISKEEAERRRNLIGSGNGADPAAERSRLTAELGKTFGEEKAANEDRQKATQDRFAAEQRKNEAEARSKLANGPELKRALADDAEQRAVRAATGAQKLAFGSQTADQSIDALDRVLRNGVARSDPREVQLAQSIAPLTVSKLAEKEGAADPRQRRLQQLAPADFTGDPEKLRQDAAKKLNEAITEEFKTNQDLAKANAENAKGFAEVMGKLLKDYFDLVKKELLNQQATAKANNPG